MKIPGETSRPSPLQTPELNLTDRGRRGVWTDLQDPASIELICAEGPDWICIDGQHGQPEFADLRGLIDAANVFGVPAIVRVPGHDAGSAGRVTDAGAQGIIFPTVEDGAADPDGVLRDIARRCADAGVPASIYSGSPELSAAPVSWGYSFMPIASDYSLLSTATRGVLAKHAARYETVGV